LTIRISIAIAYCNFVRWRTLASRIEPVPKCHQAILKLRGRYVDRRISEAVQRTLHDLVEDGIEIGVQVAAFVGEELVASACAGVADTATGCRVQQDTLFNTFSVSKAITATALHLQAERCLVEHCHKRMANPPLQGPDGPTRVGQAIRVLL
jgi:CubicO group peptidase (beta-lactamase class C family)